MRYAFLRTIIKSIKETKDNEEIKKSNFIIAIWGKKTPKKVRRGGVSQNHL